MLFNGLNPAGDSTSKFPHGEQGSRLEEHPLSWTSHLRSRLMLYLAGIRPNVTVGSGSPSLYSEHTPSSTLMREEVCHVSQLWDKEEERVFHGVQAQCRNPGDCPAMSVEVEGNPRHSCDFVPVSGVAALCDTVMPPSAPVWR